jgi:hypothetical protein
LRIGEFDWWIHFYEHDNFLGSVASNLNYQPPPPPPPPPPPLKPPPPDEDELARPVTPLTPEVMFPIELAAKALPAIQPMPGLFTSLVTGVPEASVRGMFVMTFLA